MSTNSGNRWECSGKLENESGASPYFALGKEPRIKFAHFCVDDSRNKDIPYAANSLRFQSYASEATNGFGHKIHLTVFDKVETIDVATENITRAGSRIIVKATIDKSKAQKFSGRTFYPAVIKAKGDYGYDATFDKPIWVVMSKAARCAAQR